MVLVFWVDFFVGVDEVYVEFIVVGVYGELELWDVFWG